jgi:adenosylcobinamide kinase/adenosylcobinamide-phosphate guanylyltransferase
MNQITLVTGGARSGKSRYAVETALKSKKRVFIATAIAFDDGMQQRINAHKSERADRFTTIEEPCNLADALNAVPADADIVLIDCMTVWLGNLMHRHQDNCNGFSKFNEVEDFLNKLKEKPFNIIIVTNEVGSSIVPENKMARDFRDLAGRLNQNIAAIADNVILTVCGIPTAIKGAI